jgi:predicted HicB family RNase H-like nuclease
MTKTFPVQLPEELHRQLKHASIDEGMSLHDWIVRTLEDRVKNGAPKPKSTQTNARASRNSR